MEQRLLLPHKPVPDTGHCGTVLRQFIMVCYTCLFLQGKVVDTTSQCAIGRGQITDIVAGHQACLCKRRQQAQGIRMPE